MRLPRCRLWSLVVALFLVVALPSDGRSVRANDLTSGALTGVAPGAPKVLLIKQESPDWPAYSQQIEMVLRHFTPNTTTVSTERYTDDQLLDFHRVVVLHNETIPLPSVLLEDLARADRPILWLGYGLNQLPVDTGTTFGFSLEDIKAEDLPNGVEYRGQRYPAKLSYYYPVRIVEASAQVLASYTYGDGQTSIPYIVRGDNLWYVNGLPAPTGDYPDAEADALFLVFADVLHDFFGTSINASRQAVIRLEDVSVHIPLARLTKMINYLHSRRIPFTMGVIPAQRMKDGSIVELSDRPEFVQVLRYAQDHGGTIILHGYHHTFGSGEDYEFWDEKRDAPIAGETWDMYAHKVEDGIRILRNNGIEPRLWETPHYAASPLAYRVFSHYFSHTIENRRPVTWLPYPAGPDQYGQMVIPETIGYIHPADGKSVERQLQRADTLRIVRDSWAVGFVHPASIELSRLETLVEGLQRQGYTFADIRALPTEVRYDYRPNALARLNTWRTVDLELNLEALDYRLESQYDWWPTVRVVPWLSILLVSSIVIFIVRLRKQWQPDAATARSIVGSLGGLGSRRALHPTRRSTVLLVGVMALLGGILLFGGRNILLSEEWPEKWSGSDRLHGWSNLDWTVAYDGYGEVGVEDGSASLRPATSERPLETHAALALAGGPNWRNYTFETRMNLHQQLRENSSPNEWEAGWLLFRYLGEARSYYLIHKTNGIELGKLVPPEGEGQIFLVTKPRPRVVPGRWYDYRIEVRGANIKVYIDDELQIDYTDPDPILRGGVGLYTEDAHVYFRQPTVTERRPVGSTTLQRTRFR
jgi:hypothetical protein